MPFSGAIDHRIEEECTGGKIDHRCPDNAERTDVPARKARRHRRSDIPLPENAPVGGVQRINIVRRSHGNDHRAVWTALDIKRLGVNMESTYRPSRERLLFFWVTLTCAFPERTALHRRATMSDEKEIRVFIN